MRRSRWLPLLLAAVLSSALAACGDSHGDGAAEATPTASSTPSPRPTAFDLATLAGTYDASVYGDSTTGTPIGVVSTTTADALQIRIDVATLEVIELSAMLQSDGSLALAGNLIQGGDAYLYSTGTADVTSDDREQRIVGTITNVFGAVPFSLVRPAAGTPSAFAGVYVFAFDPSPSFYGCPVPPARTCATASRTQLQLALAADGHGTLGSGVDVSPPDDPRDATGVLLGTFAEASCIVSGTGRMRCDGAYHPTSDVGSEEVSETLSMQGELPNGSRAGTGSYRRGTPPAFFLTGAWTIE